MKKRNFFLNETENNFVYTTKHAKNNALFFEFQK